MKYSRILFGLCCLMCLMACDKEYFKVLTDPDDPTERKIVVKVKIKTDLLPVLKDTIWTYLEDSVSAIQNTRTRMKQILPVDTEEYDLRFITDIYPRGNILELTVDKRIDRVVTTLPHFQLGENTVEVNFPFELKDYMLLVWVDYVKAGETSDLYYKTNDLTQLALLKPRSAFSNAQCAYTAIHTLELAKYADLTTDVDHIELVQTEIPFAQYSLITTDMAQFDSVAVSKKPSTTRVSYHLWFPTGFNVATGDPCKYTSNIYFIDPVKQLNADQAVLASGYIFMYKSRTRKPEGNDMNIEDSFDAQVDIRTAGGTVIKRNGVVEIPLKRAYLTLLQGHFLTGGNIGPPIDPEDPNNNGNVGIDDNFDDEIIIELKN